MIFCSDTPAATRRCMAEWPGHPGQWDAGLQQHYQRLSEIEKQAIGIISNEIDPISFTQFLAKCQGSQGELFKAIQSLARRGMIEKLSCETETVFTIPPVLKQYVKMMAE